MLKRTVVSSNVSSIGYDPSTQTLEVEFLSGSVYQYYGVPKQIYDEIMRAPSKGQFLHTYVKNGYAYSRVA